MTKNKFLSRAKLIVTTLYQLLLSASLMVTSLNLMKTQVTEVQQYD